MQLKRLLLVLSSIAALLLVGALPGTVDAKAEKKFKVELIKCIDGDTAEFSVVGKSRFLYVDTPESTNKIEPYGKEASKYTCDQLTKAKKIELQYDGTKKDKYDRALVWVWVDDKLLQLNLVKLGYVKKFYDYGKYEYEKQLVSAMATAKKNKVGLYSGKKSKLDTTAPATTTPSNNTVKFKNCTEMRKVHPNGVPSTHPSYEAKHDRDKDNWACEK